MSRGGRIILFCTFFLLNACPALTEESSHNSQFPRFEVVTSSNFETEIAIELPEPVIEEVYEGGQRFHSVQIPHAGWMMATGKPELPVMARLVAIPRGASVSVEIGRYDFSILEGITVRPCQDTGFKEGVARTCIIDSTFYAQDCFSPQHMVEVGSPVILRDLEAVPLIYYPVQYNPGRRELKVLRNLNIRLTYQEGDHHEGWDAYRAIRSEAFEKLYRSSVLNYTTISSSQETVRGGYLIVTPDYYYDALQPLVQWKRQKGYHTEVVTLSQIGSNPNNNQIRNYILNYYQQTSVPLEYVLLVGDVHELPTFIYQDEMETGREWDATDHPYSMMEGADYFPDVFVGRLSVINENQLHTVVNKIVSYERDPYMGRTAWYKRALMVCNYEGNASARTTKIWVREKLLEKGYSDVPTSFTFSNFECDVGFIESVVNSGVSFINYRGVLDWGGWTSAESYYNINGLHNGFMLPVVTDMVCRAGAFFDDCPAEAWLRAGTVMSPRGAVAAIGPTAINTKVYFNNVLDGGFYAAIFDDSLYTISQALSRAKMELYMQYPLNRGPGHAWNSVECYFYMYALLGDPGLDMWTDIPKVFAVEHPITIEAGSNTLMCTVKDSDNQPLRNARVCLTRAEQILSTGLTDSDGSINLPLSVRIGESIRVTVTKHNFQPYQGIMIGVPAPILVVPSDHMIDDDPSGESWGDGDGRVNPAETIEFDLALLNAGTSITALNVSAETASDDSHVNIIQNAAHYGDISPGQSKWGQEAFLLSISPDCPDGHDVALVLQISDGGGRTWSDVLNIHVLAPNLVLQTFGIEDTGQGLPNSQIDPGETVRLTLILSNEGQKAGDNIQATLKSDDPNLTLIDSTATFETIPIGGQGDNGDDPFVFSVDLTTFMGHQAQFTLSLESNSGIIDVTVFYLPVGNPSSSDPSGPDSYGYFAYDDSDWRYYDKPTYEWFEIDPFYGGKGNIIYLIDEPGPDEEVWVDYPQGDTRGVYLPFNFRYYGNTYNQISVCSNGWLSVGSTWMTDFRNWAIPAVLSPPCIIAPFWDDLYLGGESGNGHVVSYYDEPNHRFIVEWSRVYNDYDDSPLTFQAILHDPAYYPTVTGDGEILFQYQTVSNADYAWNFATVGIESPDKKGGVEYTYAGLYQPGASELTDGMAIKFTTGKDLPPGPYLNYYGFYIDDDAMGGSIGDADGLVDAGEQIELTLRLINYGQEMAQGVTAILSSDDSGALIQNGVQTFPDIAPGDTALCDEPYLIAIAPDCENGHIIHIVAKTQSSGLFCSYTDFDIEVVAPVILYEVHSVDDVQGDGDGRGESGETCELVVTLENVGEGQAIEVWGLLTTEDEQITILDDTAVFPDMTAHSLRANVASPYVFRVDDETQHHYVSFHLTAYSNGDHYVTNLTFEVIVERANILLVDDDGGDTLEVYFTEALNEQNWSRDYHDRVTDGGLDTFMIREYESIIWFTGNERDSTLTPFDQDRLRAFLDAGGNLFLTGQDIGYDLVEDGTPDDEAFYQDYLHADFVRDISESDILMGVSNEHLISGVSQSNILGLVYGGAGNQTSPSVISPRKGAKPIYIYSTTTDAAAIKYSKNYKLVYFAFGFEAIGSFVGQDHAETRARLMKNITDWFLIGGEKGDVNKDGLMNALDVVLAIRIKLGAIDPSPRESWAADYDGDGQLNVVDVLGIVNGILDGNSRRFAHNYYDSH